MNPRWSASIPIRYLVAVVVVAPFFPSNEVYAFPGRDAAATVLVWNMETAQNHVYSVGKQYCSSHNISLYGGSGPAQRLLSSVEANPAFEQGLSLLSKPTLSAREVRTLVSQLKFLDKETAVVVDSEYPVQNRWERWDYKIGKYIVYDSTEYGPFHLPSSIETNPHEILANALVHHVYRAWDLAPAREKPRNRQQVLGLLWEKYGQLLQSYHNSSVWVFTETQNKARGDVSPPERILRVAKEVPPQLPRLSKEQAMRDIVAIGEVPHQVLTPVELQAGWNLRINRSLPTRQSLEEYVSTEEGRQRWEAETRRVRAVYSHITSLNDDSLLNYVGARSGYPILEALIYSRA